MKLVYIGDPMCSWCYGFGKELAALTRQHPELPLQIIVGGLRVGGTEVLDQAGKQFRLAHWARVGAASGLPFNREGLMARENFIYDTEPICRAVVTARIIAPQADLLQVFRALQAGFYVDAADTTDAHILAALGAKALAEAGHGIDAAAFLAVWQAGTTIAATRDDFAIARHLGVRSFPALLLERDGLLEFIGSGYAAADELERLLQQLLLAQPAVN